MSTQIEMTTPEWEPQDEIESLRRQLADCREAIQWLSHMANEKQRQLAEKDAEIERLKTESRDACIGLNDYFGQQLAASQAREQQANECRIALVHQLHELADHIERSEYCINDTDMLKQMLGQRAHAMSVASQWNQNGNPFSADTAALEAMIAKAGDVMRERCSDSAQAEMDEQNLGSAHWYAARA